MTWRSVLLGFIVGVAFMRIVAFWRYRAETPRSSFVGQHYEDWLVHPVIWWCAVAGGRLVEAHVIGRGTHRGVRLVRGGLC